MKTLRAGTQSARLLDWLRHHPGVSSLDITLALRIVNVTGRVSDLRAAGYVIECRQDTKGVDRYYLVAPITGEQVEMGLAS